jgi:predicted nucleotidyltransferase
LAVLYGSFARGEATTRSDLDLMIIARPRGQLAVETPGLTQTRSWTNPRKT